MAYNFRPKRGQKYYDVDVWSDYDVQDIKKMRCFATRKAAMKYALKVSLDAYEVWVNGFNGKGDEILRQWIQDGEVVGDYIDEED